jgi:hypothetical protein
MFDLKHALLGAACAATPLFVGCGGGGGGGGGATPGPQAGPTPSASSSTHGLTNLFFLHHSVGDGLVVEGGMRERVTAYNAQNGASFVLWDHGYNGDGLRNAAGAFTGTNYDIPDDNTDPEYLHRLWTSSEGGCVMCRTRILTNHQVIAFKSCFPNSAIDDASMLDQYKAWYVSMRGVFDTRPDRVFVVMSTPPLHRLSTDPVQAKNARTFATWLCSPEYLSGHPNVACFDLFDQLAARDDGSATANMLRREYEQSPDDGDSHPNAAANQAVGPRFADFLCQTAARY